MKAFSRRCRFIFTFSLIFILLLLANFFHYRHIPRKNFLSIFDHLPDYILNQSDFLSKITLQKNFKPQNSEPTIVLAWSNHHGGAPWETIKFPLFKNCAPNLNCVITSDRKLFNQSKAVIFHLTTPYWWDATPWRRPDQYFVFALWEPPTHSSSGFNSAPNFFNLTMTYRKDSDIFWPYGILRPRLWPATEGDMATWLGMVPYKTKMAAWVVSVCQTPSGRETYVNELKKYLQINIFGGCSPLKCARDPKRDPTALGTKSPKPCDRILQDYKFYLAFENSLCQDYTTEKFFERIDNLVIIPVVMEREIVLKLATDEKSMAILNRSIIAADDFKHPKKLAEYLKYLDKNLTAYNRYLEWRREYEVHFEDEFKPGCDLCMVIKEGNQHQVKDIKKWWVTDAKCHRFKQTNFTNG